MRKTIVKVLSYVLVAVIAAGTTAIFFVGGLARGTGKLDELQTLLDQCFIGDVDQAQLEDAAAAAMVEALGDEWSYYMTAEDFLSHQETMSNSYAGVGIIVKLREDFQGFDVTQVTKGGPAEEAGVQPGDILIGVDDTSLIEIDVSKVTRLIRGEEGTSVTLVLKRGEQTLELTMVRRRIETTVTTGQLLEDNIGLVTIENFEGRCAEETIAVIETLLEQGAQSLIFDVRNNPGGYKTELVEVLDYLLPSGEIFRSVDYAGNKDVDYSDEKCLDIPMAVLVNLESYSAAEFFAATLDYYDAAVIVGEKTYGKGYFQTSYQLQDGSAVNLSIGKYYTPDGKSLAGVGLTPDVELLVDEETEKAILLGTLAPEDDPQLQAAINALKQ